MKIEIDVKFANKTQEAIFDVLIADLIQNLGETVLNAHAKNVFTANEDGREFISRDKHESFWEAVQKIK